MAAGCMGPHKPADRPAQRLPELPDVLSPAARKPARRQVSRALEPKLSLRKKTDLLQDPEGFVFVVSNSCFWLFYTFPYKDVSYIYNTFPYFVHTFSYFSVTFSNFLYPLYLLKPSPTFSNFLGPSENGPQGPGEPGEPRETIWNSGPTWFWVQNILSGKTGVQKLVVSNKENSKNALAHR